MDEGLFSVGSSARPSSFRSPLRFLLPVDVRPTAAHERSGVARAGQMGDYQALSGRVLASPEPGQPYKVVLTFRDGSTTEHPVETYRDGQHFIRRCVRPTGAQGPRAKL